MSRASLLHLRPPLGGHGNIRARAIGPKILQFGWQQVPDVLDLAFTEAKREYRENTSSRQLGIHVIRTLELLGDSLQKFVSVANSERLATRIPAFVVQAADQNW